jgi:hypothetical protein
MSIIPQAATRSNLFARLAVYPFIQPRAVSIVPVILPHAETRIERGDALQ